MTKIPITFIIDDPAPVISIYHEHANSAFTKDGRPLVPTYPNELLNKFCDIIERHGIKGKFSVVPMPGNKGDIINGLDGVPDELLKEWLDTVKNRVVPQFTIGPEMLSHHKAVDLNTGKALDVSEKIWSETQDRNTFTPYISLALKILKDAGFNPIGVTSPWNFGIKVEDEYVAAISKAVYDVSGSKNAWYFLHELCNVPGSKPWVEYDDGEYCVVSIPSTTSDHIWQTINCADESDEYVKRVADEIITSDGSDGEMIQVLNHGGYPILLTHWQSLMSNGLGTGLRVLDEVGRRININLSDRVEWMRFEEMLCLVVANKEEYLKPDLI